MAGGDVLQPSVQAEAFVEDIPKCPLRNVGAGVEEKGYTAMCVSTSTTRHNRKDVALSQRIWQFVGRHRIADDGQDIFKMDRNLWRSGTGKGQRGSVGAVEIVLGLEWRLPGRGEPEVICPARSHTTAFGIADRAARPRLNPWRHNDR